MAGLTSRRDVEFGAYVEQRRARLYRTAYLLCGDPHLAEDIVQNALAKLYAAWSRASRAHHVDAYARRAVVNAHIDETRRPWRRDHSVDPSPGGVLDRADRTGPSVEDADALWTALRGLAPGQRRVVVLRHYLGLSVEETAADLGISPGTVKSQTSDALAALRLALGDETIGERR